MAQLCDFVTNAEKPREWHVYFLRELLEHVSAEKPTERRYMKWLRERKVYDRKLVAFCERLCGIERPPLQAPELGEVARELLAAIEKAKKKADEDAAKARAALAKKPARDVPRPRATNPDEELDEEKAFAAGGTESPHAKTPPEAVLTDDPFVKGVLERAVELHAYLAKFVFRELGNEFLAVTELYRRIGTSAFAGKRPSLPQFEAWIRWQEWLGGLSKVGFRHKATEAGKDHGRALKDVPDSELTAPSREDELAIEAAPAQAAPAPTGGALVANAPTGRRSLEVREDDEDMDASGEGLELPPTREPPPVEEWREQATPEERRLPDPVIAPKPFSEVMRELTDAAGQIAPPNGKPAPPPISVPAPAPVPLLVPGPLPVPVQTAVPVQGPVPVTGPAGLLVAWWRQSGRPGDRLTAREAGIDLTLYRGAGRGLVVFELLALASFLEVSPRGRGLAFYRELASRRSFEALFHEEAPLERVLDLDPARPLAYGAQLVSLLRFRRALKKDGVLARLDSAPDGRELARTLRRDVTGDALSTGILLVVREMAQAGHWRPGGVDSLSCVPWREAREAAWRLGLLASPAASTFEEALAASEALSRHLGASDENETPLLAFAAREPFPERGTLP